MVIIAGYALYDEGQRDALPSGVPRPRRARRAFDGCIDMAITADSVDPRRANLLEVWESAEALDAWRAKAKRPRTASNPPRCR
jgi:quinol monooxygenase YgiN